ncbi:MAG: 4Fe-4S dicluster domain-containing protein, partial [Ardenticatenaceae bacterium]|nr:4Fe-4S dicluster domain-containing protein [Ardenticatenaceae bacterium]
IVPYVQQPEELVPGRPLFFASTHVQHGYGHGVLVESNMGRPTKVEGNPDHPASLGATDVFDQASLLSLYDPDRSQTVLGDGRIRTWAEFDEIFVQALGQLQAAGGAGLAILTPTITSPSLADQLTAVLDRFPQAQWRQYDPVNQDNTYAGTQMAFGEPLEVRYRFQQADVILSLDADFLFHMPGHLAYTRDYSQRRTVRQDAPEMNRLYVVESTPTLTGSMADHRWPLSPAQVETFARHVAAALGVDVATGPAPSAAFTRWATAVADDLRQHAGRCLILAGVTQPDYIHALAHTLNARLGNVGQTVVYTPPVAAGTTSNAGSQTEGLRALAADMHDGAVELLLILDSNPVYTAPADLEFAAALANVPLSVHLGLYADETAVRCAWHLPQTHYLESWGDARAYDGTASIIQPLIEPLYNGRSAYELLALMVGAAGRTAFDVVASYWQGQAAGAPAGAETTEDTGGATGTGGPQNATGAESVGSSESAGGAPGADSAAAAWWQNVLRAGVVPGTQLAPLDVAPSDGVPSALALPEPPGAAGEGLYLLFRPSDTVGDGRYSNNSWLQETPHPFTKLTWGNAALISPRLAEQMGLANEAVVRLTADGRSIDAPVWILPGQADDCVTVHLGYGRSTVGRVGEDVGFNAYALRTSGAPWVINGLQLDPTGQTADLVTTQNHHVMEGRSPVQSASLDTFLANPGFVEQHPEAELPSLYPDYTYDGYAWGMSIDLNLCIGCNACTVACQAENNIPVVGKEGVANGREMHWIRVDGYYKGDLDNPELLHQPVPCMHCEKAPCELVCPVAATTHSNEGLNEMTYNRCVGTRYCSNNCPYKVRRFNFLDYAGSEPSLILLARNPDVTVRARGVMEKCTYCVQRINRARIATEEAGRSIQDGDLVTACQQVCPAQAITFGDINNESSQVAQLKAQPHNYGLLSELNTRPRTSYLARLRNLNPALAEETNGS